MGGGGTGVHSARARAARAASTTANTFILGPTLKEGMQTKIFISKSYLIGIFFILSYSQYCQCLCSNTLFGLASRNQQKRQALSGLLVWTQRVLGGQLQLQLQACMLSDAWISMPHHVLDEAGKRRLRIGKSTHGAHQIDALGQRLDGRTAGKRVPARRSRHRCIRAHGVKTAVANHVIEREEQMVQDAVITPVSPEQLHCIVPERL